MSNLIIDTPSRHVYTGDGSTRVFPIPALIEGDDWIRIEINGEHQIDRRQWDIVNNSIIFVTAPEAEATIDVLVASSIEAMTQFGSSSAIDVVAENITNVNKVANIDTDVTKVADIDLDVTTVASISLEVPIVASIATDVTTVASIGSEVITVADIDLDVTTVAAIAPDVTTVANNIVDVQNAEENAIIAKEEAWRAEAERLTANSYATEPEDFYVKLYTSNNDGTFTITDTIDYSSYHWERKATALVTTGVIDDVTSSADRTYSSNKIDSIVSTINDNITTIVTDNITPIENNIDNIEGDVLALQGNVSTLNSNVATLNNTTVKLTGNQTVGDVKTFTSSPIVPTPTTDYQVATKKYVDDNVLLSPNDNRVKTALNASGEAPIFACRAWVYFNGTGTVAIRASGNVSSITDNGVGQYTVNFTTAMQDDEFSASGMVGVGGTPNINVHNISINNKTVTNIKLKTISSVASSDAFSDFAIVYVQIFR